MTQIKADDFLEKLELKGVYLDKSNKLNIGFTYENVTFKQKSNFKVTKHEQILFQHEEVVHLNQSKTEKNCPLCNKVPVHLSQCTFLSSAELQNVVIENALEKIEKIA